MSFLSSLSSGAFSLRPTRTRVTDLQGRVRLECKAFDGVYEIVDEGAPVRGPGQFMVVDDSPDDCLHSIPLPLPIASSLSPSLFVSSQDGASNHDHLHNHGITHILNAATGVPNYFPDDFVYLNLRLLDLPSEPISDAFGRSNTFISEAIKGGGRVLVHCNAGISRSVTLILSYLLSAHGLALTEALALVRSSRPAARPNEGFMEQLKQYEQKINSNTTNIENK